MTTYYAPAPVVGYGVPVTTYYAPAAPVVSYPARVTAYYAPAGTGRGLSGAGDDLLCAGSRRGASRDHVLSAVDGSLTVSTLPVLPLPPLPPRKPDAHKGDFGRALLVGGSRGMSGAIALAGLAALRSGAGLGDAGSPGRLPRDRGRVRALLHDDAVGLRRSGADSV